MTRDSSLSDLGLSGSEVQTWTEEGSKGKTKYVCFRNGRGEYFHFVRSKLMRGKPHPGWNLAEELPRPHTMLTIENAHHISGISAASLSKAVSTGKLKATKRVWRYGIRHRSGLFIDISDLEQYMAKKAIERYKGRMIEWDMDPLRLVREAAR